MRGCLLLLPLLLVVGGMDGMAWAGSPVTALAFRPDGKVLVSGGPRVIEVRSPEDGQVLRRVAHGLPKISALVFAPDGRWLAAVGGTPGVSGAVLLLDGGAEAVRAVVSNGTDVATSAAWDARGDRLVVSGADKVAQVWRVVHEPAGLLPGVRYAGHTGPVLAAGFGPDGRWVVTAGADRTVAVWSAADGRLRRSFGMHTEAVHALAVRPWRGEGEAGDRWECATGGDDRTVRVWQPGIGRMMRIVRHHEGSILALAYAPDGKVLYSLGREGVLRCFDADSDALLWATRVSEDWGYALAVSPDGWIVATGDAAGELRVTRPPRR